jgi:hypothetical protein
LFVFAKLKWMPRINITTTVPAKSRLYNVVFFANSGLCQGKNISYALCSGLFHVLSSPMLVKSKLARLSAGRCCWCRWSILVAVLLLLVIGFAVSTSTIAITVILLMTPRCSVSNRGHTVR